MLHSVKRIFIAIFILSLCALAAALFSQHMAGMRPCAWCVLQRLILIASAVVGLAGALYAKPRHADNSVPVTAILALTGMAVAVSGVAAAWYQYTVAATQFSCAQTFADRFMTGLGLDAAIPWLFGIYATCMDARVELFGIEYALWGLGTFVVLIALSGWALVVSVRR